MTRTKSKERHSISLSLDWDKIFNKGIHSLRTAAPESAIHFSKETVNFCTGSSYTGKWNMFGMTSDGTYVFPQECKYVGGFEDGMFHGKGDLIYPMGQRLACYWDKGKMISCKFNYVDGLDQDAGYCTMPDRRFLIETREGLRPPGREYLTNQHLAREIPADCYDTGDGFFSGRNQCILAAREDTQLDSDDSKESLQVVKETEPADIFWVNTLTVASPEREKWIRSHCRKAWDEPAGYRPDFFEDWTSGRASELRELEKKYTSTQDLKETVAQREEAEEPQRDSTVITATTTYAGTGRKLIPGSKQELLHM